MSRFHSARFGVFLSLACIALYACSPVASDDDQPRDASSKDGGGEQDAGNQDLSCAKDNGGCDPLVMCDDADGEVRCSQCPSGYNDTGKDGKSCVDIDECATENGGCGSAALFTCTNQAGSAPTCADRDECETDNGGCGDAEHFLCTNNMAAPPTCSDIDECAGSNVCTPEYPCQNRDPYYVCRGQLAEWTPSDSPSTFADNGNGTVTDSRSDLVWQQVVDASTYTWANAKTYCTGLALAGRSWRLPTRAELESLIDFSITNPSIDGTAFPSAPNEAFWSASSYSVTAGNAWRIYFSSGASGYASVTEANRVRCVSGNESTAMSLGSGGVPPGRYSLEVNGVVLDPQTGLTWEQTTNVNLYMHAQAVSYCNNLAALGGGWRLPSISELLTLVDSTQFDPAMDDEAFPDAPAESYWTSTVYVDDTALRWFIAFYDGLPFLDDASEQKRVRCVR